MLPELDIMLRDQKRFENEPLKFLRQKNLYIPGKFIQAVFLLTRFPICWDRLNMIPGAT